jgi:hypothetical protein
VDAGKLRSTLQRFQYPAHLTKYLFEGFTQGFSIECSNIPDPVISPNLPSLEKHPLVAAEKIQEELSAGRIQGPFDSPPFENFISSPLGLVPKDNGKFRLIHHLSFPHGRSVNDNIPDSASSVSYTRVSDAVKSIKSFGVPCFLAKTDIESAYRLVPICPNDHKLLGLQFQGKLYFDCCLPMGLSSSCKVFEAFSSALEFIINKKCPQTIVHHLIDDFLVIGPTKELCQQTLEKFLDLCAELNVPIAERKTEGPHKF